MKLDKILENLNTLEKNAFIKVIDGLISNCSNKKEIEQIISECDNSDLKSLDHKVISRIFNLLEDEFAKLIKLEFLNTSSQLDILIDIIVRDGNCIMKQDWFSQLYEQELKNIKKKTKALKKQIELGDSELEDARLRDYRVYKSCLNTAYNNDLDNNRDAKITDDELSILITLASMLELSLEEVKLINYLIVPVEKRDVDDIINELRNTGILFFSRKSRTVYIADEVVRALRKIRKKDLADKHYRRVLRCMKEPVLNLVCKKHNIDRKLGFEEKVNEVVNEGVSFRFLLSEEIFKDSVSLTDRKKYLNELWEKGLGVDYSLKGSTLDEKIDNILSYFEVIENDEKVSISQNGYESLLLDLKEVLPAINSTIKKEFQLQEEFVLKSDFLVDYNIKPLDILDLASIDELKLFCQEKEIKSRGNLVQNILDNYLDSGNLLLENYINIGFRDANALKDNNIKLKESDIGLKFEELTAQIFSELGFDVDDQLKKKLNTKKDKIDLLLNLGDNNLILVECKTVKDSGYNKFSSVSRQMQSYVDLAESNGYTVIKSLLIAPDFSDDFVSDTELEFDLNLSLIKAESLFKILKSFEGIKKHKVFPYKLLLKDVLIDENRIIKAMNK